MLFMQLTQKQIINTLKSIKQELSNDGISKLGLFGSFASGKADLLSDVDIVIKTTDKFIKKYQGIQAFIFLDDLKARLKPLLQNRNIDICDESGLKNKNILQGAIYV